jgi:membrane associated rhomboid family serine protease
VVTYALIAACGVVFGYELSLGPKLDRFIEAQAFVPQTLTAALAGKGSLLDPARRAVVSMFLHGGWFHVIGNLLYLRVFGDNIEDRMGPIRFLIFYVVAGLVGTLAHYAVVPDSGVPMVGASWAIAGVLGAYLVVFPSARIVTLFPVFIFLTFIEVPAFVFLGLWAAQQYLYGILTLEDGLAGVGGVAWFAHLGGFAIGVGAGIWLRMRKRRRRR